SRHASLLGLCGCIISQERAIRLRDQPEQVVRLLPVRAAKRNRLRREGADRARESRKPALRAGRSLSAGSLAPRSRAHPARARLRSPAVQLFAAGTELFGGGSAAE